MPYFLLKTFLSNLKTITFKILHIGVIYPWPMLLNKCIEMKEMN